MISLKYLPPLPRPPQIGGRFGAISLLLAMLAAGCAQAPVRPAIEADEGAQQVREAMLATQADWAFRGRVALSLGGKGGNAGIRWRQQGADYQIELSAPITAQSWRLKSQAGRVSLEGIEGGPREGSDAEAMLLEATGWRIPVAAMSAWARGARAPGSQAALTVDAQARPALLRQDGWNIEYRAWFEGQPPLPQKVFARQDDASVRLVIDAWEP
jgi:outer membrane lipoprotein LolB